MSGGGGSTSTNTIQKADPWSAAQPYLKGALADAAKWYQGNAGRTFFPGSTVVPFSPFTEQALGMTADRAMAGSPLIRSAQTNLQNTVEGDFLDPSSNPWLSRTFDLAAGKVRSAIDSQFNASGGYGGSLHEGAMAENLGDLATKIYGGNYDAERTRQLQSMFFAPQMAQQDYFDAAQMAGVGSAYEGQAGNYLSDAIKRWEFSQNEPFMRLQQLASLINPIAGQGGTTQSTTTQPSNSNTFSNVLGTGLGLTSLASALGLFGAGAAGTAGAGAAAAMLPLLSDRNMKTNIEPTDDDEVLDLVKRVGSDTYEYVPELGPEFGGLRMGPMAQNFSRELGGPDDRIPMPKLLGVLWSSNLALARKLDKLEKRAA